MRALKTFFKHFNKEEQNANHYPCCTNTSYPNATLTESHQTHPTKTQSGLHHINQQPKETCVGPVAACDPSLETYNLAVTLL